MFSRFSSGLRSPVSSAPLGRVSRRWSDQTDRRLKILVSAFCCDAYDVSEDLDGFNWVKEFSRHCDVTLFTLGRPGRACGTEGMPHVETHLYPQTRLGVKHPQLERTLLPSYLPFSWFSYRKAREAMRRERFDLVHQVTPAALRFASSMALLGLPFVLGPVGGGVPVPSAFKSDLGGEPLYFRLRGLDRLRLKTDPTLLYTLSKASKVLVQGDYAAEMLPASAKAKCEVMLGAGFDSLPPADVRNSKSWRAQRPLRRPRHRHERPSLRRPRACPCRERRRLAPYGGRRRAGHGDREEARGRAGRR